MEFRADLAPFSLRVFLSLYSDGVAEGEEGFLVLIGIVQDQLDERDRGSVDLLQQALLVSLRDGGGECTCAAEIAAVVNLG